jgi:predicted metalloprotease
MRRIAALLILVVVLAGHAGIAVSEAKALNPMQTTVSGVVNKELPDLNSFWKTAFTNGGLSYLWRNTGVGLYNPGWYTNSYTACGWTSATFWASNAVYCPDDFSIYIDQTWVQGLLNGHGDGAAAFILAHEYGHHIGHLLGNFVGKKGIERELNADCLAGMYFRWGILGSRLLHSNDYSEAVAMIYHDLGGDPTGHGTAELRVSWFKYGYTSYDANKCNLVFTS